MQVFSIYKLFFYFNFFKKYKKKIISFISHVLVIVSLKIILKCFWDYQIDIRFKVF